MAPGSRTQEDERLSNPDGEAILYGRTASRGAIRKVPNVDLGYAHQNYEQILFALGHRRWVPVQRLAEKLHDPEPDAEAFSWTDDQVGPYIDQLIDMEADGLVKNDVGVPGARLFTVRWQITDAGMELSAELLYHYYATEKS